MAKANENKANEVKTEETKATFVIESGVELPTKTSGKTSPYPFDQLENGQSFKVESPAAKMNSVVAFYNRKYSEETTEQKKGRKGEMIPVRKALRKFAVRSIDANSCRVFRIE